MKNFKGLPAKRPRILWLLLLVALSACMAGCGAAEDARTAEKIALADEWAQSTGSQNYTVQTKDGEIYAVYDVPQEQALWPGRAAARLTFAEQENGLQVAESEPVAEDGVASLDDFCLLYENDLGLPDFVGDDTFLFDNNFTADVDPAVAAKELLRLLGDAEAQPMDIAPDGTFAEVKVNFPDGSEVSVTMVMQFGAFWLPQDYTYNGGQNERTAADLAGQYARAVMHKSGQFIYPIMSAALQQEFYAERLLPDDAFNWKYGGSSPTARDYAIVPGPGEDSYVAVFRMDGGGMTDYRSAQLITVGRQEGRTVITAIDRCDDWLGLTEGDADSSYTQSELFGLYYGSGLPWPKIPEGAESFNGEDLAALTSVQKAAETVFGMLGEYVERTEGEQQVYEFESWFECEVLSEGDAEAVVRLNFADGSRSAEVQMEKTDGYWLPTGLVEAARASK